LSKLAQLKKLFPARMNLFTKIHLGETAYELESAVVAKVLI
jgi:hypothetical protein